MTTVLILNVVLAVAVFAVVIAHHAWSILTQQGDRPHVLVTDTARRRRRLGLRPRPAEPRPAYSQHEARPGRAWPVS